MNLLLIAQSARMLAQSAARGGFCCCTIDFFADSDTRRYAGQCIPMTPGADGFDEAALLVTVEDLAFSDKEFSLIFGSGIDSRPMLVEKLAEKRKLLGNTPATLKKFNHPQAFFGLLEQLGIPYPETRFVPPDQAKGWLIKPGCSEGGKGVVFCANNPQSANGVYYQRLTQGDAYSLLFLSNGKENRAIGFNTQWTAKHEPAQPFLFAGAINRTDLTELQRSAVEEYATKLTAASGLVGLNSLDFVLSGGVCQVLEVNPRPSATMALYDEDFTQGLLALHIAACRGELPPPVSHNGPVRAVWIVYSQSAALIPVDFHWPEECADIPNPGAKIEAGQPLCSLLVRGENRQEAEKLVKLLEIEILGGLFDRPNPNSTQ